MTGTEGKDFEERQNEALLRSDAKDDRRGEKYRFHPGIPGIRHSHPGRREFLSADGILPLVRSETSGIPAGRILRSSGENRNLVSLSEKQTAEGDAFGTMVAGE